MKGLSVHGAAVIRRDQERAGLLVVRIGRHHEVGRVGRAPAVDHLLDPFVRCQYRVPKCRLAGNHPPRGISSRPLSGSVTQGELLHAIIGHSRAVPYEVERSSNQY